MPLLLDFKPLQCAATEMVPGARTIASQLNGAVLCFRVVQAKLGPDNVAPAAVPTGSWLVLTVQVRTARPCWVLACRGPGSLPACMAPICSAGACLAGARSPLPAWCHRHAVTAAGTAILTWHPYPLACMCVQFKCEQNTTITRAEDGQVVAELK